jgi:hypothetical protein
MDLAEFWATREDEALLTELRHAKQGGDTVILETGVSSGKPFANARLRNFTEFSHTLVGHKRLDHLQHCVEQVLRDEVPGDLLEAGVWRGGCCIFMRGILQAHDCTDRTVWLCDSFQGLPRSELQADQPYPMSSDRFPFLAVSEEQVRENFRRYGLLDDQVKFLPGWFSDTLKQAPVESIAVLRIDADLYSSTRDVLSHLYPRVSHHGWVIIDDYHTLPPCREAVDAYRAEHGIEDPIRDIDEQAVCWQVGRPWGSDAEST